MDFHKDKKNTEYKVGLFTILAMAILVLGYSWLVEVLEKNRYTSLRVSFPNAANVEIGSTVTINGVKRGRVEKIEVATNHVILTLLVELDFPLKEGSRFYILESNLMGEIQVEIVPGSGGTDLDLSKIQNGERHYGLTKLVAEFSEIVNGLKNVTSAISGDENIMLDLQAIIDTSKTLLNNFNLLLAGKDEKITELLDNSTRISTQMESLLDENDEKIGETINLTQTALTEFNIALLEIRQMTASMQELSDQMLNDDNSINRLISERELYDNLNKATGSMDSLLIDIKKNPKKYFEIKVF